MRAFTLAALLAVGLSAGCAGTNNATLLLRDHDAAEQQGPENLRRLRGTYGFSASGTIMPPALPQPTAAVAVGIMTFDGEGGCTISDTINIGGAVASRPPTPGSYTLAANDTGTIAVTFPGDPGPTPLAFVLVDNRRELRFIRTDLGVAEGVAKRQ